MNMELDSFDRQLINNWINRPQKEDVMNEHEQPIDVKIGLALQGIQEPSIRLAFKIAKHLNVTPSTKYMAILLYDEFMYKYLKQIYENEIACGLWKEEADKMCNNIVSKAKLYMVSCFQLASKMDSRHGIKISEVIEILQIIDSKTTYTDAMITSAEFEVFKTVGFKMPLNNTPITCIESLLAAMNWEDKMDIALVLLDTAFLQNKKLYMRLQQENMGPLDLQKPVFLKSQTIFLSAAIVTCILLRFKQGKSIFIVQALAEKSLLGLFDILTMATILFEMALYHYNSVIM